MTIEFEVGDMIVDPEACALIVKIDDRIHFEWNKKPAAASSYIDTSFKPDDIHFLIEMGRWQLKKVVKENINSENLPVNNTRKKRNNASKE